MSDDATHFADDATLELIARLEADNNTLRMRASFPLPGPIDDTGWVLECLQDGRITVSKAREWLRDYILNGKKGPLPQAPFDEPSVWERAERAEAENKELRRDAERYRWMRENSALEIMAERFGVEYVKGYPEGMEEKDLDAAIDAAKGEEK